MKLSDRLAQAGDPALPDRRPPAEHDEAPQPPPLRRPLAPRPAAPAAQRPRPRSAIVTRPTSQQSESLEELRNAVRAAAVERLGPQLVADELEEPRLRRELARALDELLHSSRVTVAPSEREAFIDDTIAEMLGWGALTPLMSDPTITEIMCNGANDVWIERDGHLESTDIRFPSDASYRQVIDRMLAVAGRRIDESSPYADARLPDGSRINAILPPLAVRGATLTIRRFPEQMYSVTDLIAMESLSTDAALFVEAAVRGKLNILVSGGTGTGKTTLLNVLSSFIPPGERVITIEDAAELRLAQPHVVTLEARPANIEGAGLVTIRDLVRNALRMRPDRIVVGEVRGGEALDMLQAMNTGHEGSLTTVHANSPRDAMSRIETMVLMSGFDLPLRAVREQMANALDLVVQLERTTDGRRVVSAITEVQGREGETITLQDVFTRSGDGPLVPSGLRPRTAELLAQRGAPVPPSVFRTRQTPEDGPTTVAGLTRRADLR